MDWIFIDDKMPNEGEYVLVKSGEDSPIGISRFIEGEWDTGLGYKRTVFTKTERFLTSASVVYWMILPLQPERLSPEDIRKNEDEILKKIMIENPSYYDPNGELPLVFDKNMKRLSHQEIMNICDSPNSENK